MRYGRILTIPQCSLANIMDTGGQENADTYASSCLNGSFSQPHSEHKEEEEEEEEMSSLEDCFRHLAQEARELYLSPEVPRLSHPPTPLEFYRDYVTPNRPVIIENAFNDFPALAKWSIPYFRERLQDKTLMVAVTPNGYADAVCGDYFVLPEEREMTFSSFLDIMEGKSEQKGVYYVQKQNSNLTLDLKELVEDIKEDIPWASEAFGHKPDAVNFWMGGHEAVTSMHKDHYENLYCVIRGAKKFILHPPTDRPFIPYGNYAQAAYKEVDGEFQIVPDPEGHTVPWIAIDPLNPDLDRHPKYGEVDQIRCTVHPGEMLYLPSLWFHHVCQEDQTVAVNYWYDMEYDIKYNYFSALEKMVNCKTTIGKR